MKQDLYNYDIFPKVFPVGSATEITAAAIYGGCMTALYCVSSIYHGLKPGMAKKVMQVIDHCTIYFLIAGTYSAVVLSSIRTLYPALGWGLFIFEWTLALVAATLTAIDLKKYEVFSMICYIGMGWAVLPFAGAVIDAASRAGFLWILWGGIAYTVGAVLYGFMYGPDKRTFPKLYER